MWVLSTEIRGQGNGLDLDVEDVVVAWEKLSDVAVDVGGQLVGISVGSDDDLGGDLN